MKTVRTCLILSFTIVAMCGRPGVAADKPAAAAIGVMLEVGSSGNCIDNAGSRKRGAGLQGWKCNKRNLNQRFALSSHRKANRATAIRNKLSNMCLDVQRQSKKSDAKIVQNTCGKSKSQSWAFMNSGTKDRFLVQARHSHLCLTLARTGKRDSILIQSRCDKRDPNQKFRVRS